MPFEKYGLEWPDDSDALEIERHCIRQGGRWTVDGAELGAGLFTHHREMESLLWPEEDHHRWSDQILRALTSERMTVLTGSRDSGKTRRISKWVLCKYWCFPHNSLFLMTSTDMRGLEMRVWGDIKSLFERARERYPWLEGSVVDAKHGIFTDDIGDDSEVRDMRKGIIGIPCISSQGEFQGMMLKNFCGIKQEKRHLVGDELQYIPLDYLKVLDSIDKGDFQCAFAGNPIGGNGKALDKVSEPDKGWGSLGPITKTREWRNKYGGLTINLYGPDSPNFDKDRPKDYPYLLDQTDIDRVLKRSGKDSLEYCSNILGVRMIGSVSNRVLTVEQVNLHGGFGDCVWSQEPDLKVYGVDGGFGGDPCVGQYIECGVEVGGRRVIRFHQPEFILVKINDPVNTVEDQIAIYTRDRCRELGVPDANVFVEPGMRATLAVSFANFLSPAINAISFGGPATQRPVCNDLFVTDDKTKERRLKTCHEHYSKFVTELWFTVAELVVSNQVRNFPVPTAEEFEARIYQWVNGDRYEIEPKPDFKKRMTYSPNRADAAAIAVEGARRLGFVIERMKVGEGKPPEPDYLEIEVREQRRLEKKMELNYF